MAISDTDQFSPQEPEITIRPPEVDDEAEDQGDAEPQFQPNAAKQQGAATDRPKSTPGGRAAKREASLAAMSTKVRDEVSGSVKQQLAEMESRFAQMILAAQGGNRQEQPQQRGPGPAESRLGEIAQAMQSELAAFQAHDARKGQYDLSRYHQLKTSHDQLNARIGAQQMLAEMGLTPQALQQMRQPQPAANVEAQVAMQTRFQTVAAAYPWINDGAADPQFKRAAAVGRYRETLIAMGRPDNVQTDLEAALHIQNAMGIRPTSAPRGNPAPYSNPLGGDRGGGGGQREVKLPTAALRGVSKQEMEFIQKALFSGEE